jgi:hypothetical protein
MAWTDTIQIVEDAAMACSNAQNLAPLIVQPIAQQAIQTMEVPVGRISTSAAAVARLRFILRFTLQRIVAEAMAQMWAATAVRQIWVTLILHRIAKVLALPIHNVIISLIPQRGRTVYFVLDAILQQPATVKSTHPGRRRLIALPLAWIGTNRIWEDVATAWSSARRICQLTVQTIVQQITQITGILVGLRLPSVAALARQRHPSKQLATTVQPTAQLTALTTGIMNCQSWAGMELAALVRKTKQGTKCHALNKAKQDLHALVSETTMFPSFQLQKGFQFLIVTLDMSAQRLATSRHQLKVWHVIQAPCKYRRRPSAKLPAPQCSKPGEAQFQPVNTCLAVLLARN